jgi:hypothetical protein
MMHVPANEKAVSLNLHRYISELMSRLEHTFPKLFESYVLVKMVGLGLRVALKDAHWPALCREPMTRDFVGFFVQSVSLFVVSTLTAGGRGRSAPAR